MKINKLLLTFLFVITGLFCYAQSNEFENVVADNVNDGSRYALQSLLKSGDFYKIAVKENGLYKLTYEALKDMGISDPSQVHVYGYGGALLEEDFRQPYVDDLPEVSIYMHKGNDNVFGPGDYIVFYGQGVTSWKYTPFRKTFNRIQNFYATRGYYFVSSNSTPLNLIQPQTSIPETAVDTIDYFSDYYLYENDELNIVNGGRTYYGNPFHNNAQLDIEFKVSNLVDQPLYITYEAAAKSKNTSSMRLEYNGEVVGSNYFPKIDGGGSYIKGKAITGYFKPITKINQPISLRLTYSEPSADAWLDYLSITCSRNLIYNPGTALFFRTTEHYQVDQIFAFKLKNISNKTQIWDVTDPTSVTRMNVSKDAQASYFKSNFKNLREYVALDFSASNFKIPELVGKIANQNLHALPQVDMVIITVDEFRNQANQIAQMHRDDDNMVVHVVSANQVYNEFSSGTPDATAYRRFMKMFYDRSTSHENAPKSLLLFGDGCFDNRGLFKARTVNNLYRLLTYQAKNSLSLTLSYTTDDYFAFLDDNEGYSLTMSLMDIAVGRIPCNTIEQAQIATDKTIAYQRSMPQGAWRNTLVYLADDGDGNSHMMQSDTVADKTAELYPDVSVNKLYLDAYQQVASASGDSYPVAKRIFDEYIQFGCLTMQYMGHGSPTGLSDERIVSDFDLDNMHNKCMPFMMTATCDFAPFDSYEMSGGERILFNPNGGTPIMLSTTRTVFSGQNALLMGRVARSLLARDPENNYKPYTLGEVVKRAKNQTITVALSPDINRLSYCLLGDPALVLPYADTHKVVTDSINGKAIESLTLDTLGALQYATIKGHIAFYENKTIGSKDTDFNGTLELSVYDKKATIETLNNENEKKTFSYQDYPNILFSGKVSVKNGAFTCRFLVPKDIRYNKGLGKIVYYASDTQRKYQANGSCYRLLVGGNNPEIALEENGPDVELYLNTPRFNSGDAVNESPTLFAYMYDDSGINRVGSGIGHDIIVRLDDDPKTEVVLNNYFRSTIDSYKEGQLAYQFKDLEEGPHTLFFRVWDLMNNSTTKLLDFTVDKGRPTVLSTVTMYPNPARDVTYISIEHDRPTLFTKVIVSVYDMMGRKVYSEDQNTMTDNSGEFTLEWNLVGTNGHKLTPGIYIINVDMIVEGGEHSRKNLKLMVK